MCEQRINRVLTEERVNRFVDFCRNKLNLNAVVRRLNNEEIEEHYGSLPLCILDSIFYTNARYQVVINATQRYANHFLDGDRFAAGHTISDFITAYEEFSNPQAFTDEYLGANNKTTKGRLKVEACYELAKKFQELGIETIEDFRRYQEKHEEELESKIKSVEGFGDSATDNLFIHCGDTSRVRVTGPIKHRVKLIFGRGLNHDYTQELFRRTVNILNEDYPTLTVADLDHAIWVFYQNMKIINI